MARSATPIYRGAAGIRGGPTVANDRRRSYRLEEDALGEVRVPAERLWGAQTERARENFPIGVGRFRWGRGVIRALGVVKKCAALADLALWQLPAEKLDLTVRGAQEGIDAKPAR